MGTHFARCWHKRYFLLESPFTHAVLRNSSSDRYQVCGSLLKLFCKVRAWCQLIVVIDAATGLLVVKEGIEDLKNAFLLC